MKTSEPQSPFNSLPPVVVALALVLLGIECVLSLGARGIVGGPEAVGWRLAALQSYSFSPDIFWWMLETSQYPSEHIMRFVSYAFIHGNFTQALFVCVFLLALGKMVAEVFGEVRMLIIFILSAISGAVVFGLLIGGPAPLIGGFPAVYGLIGAYTFILWASLGQLGEQQSRAFSLIAFLMGVQLLFGLVFGGQPDWVADLSGFAAGFGLSFLLAPGGWAKIRALIRRE
ncbi:rhomboid family intramembrane serine protease [Epibacterium ulvae]|uniref:rhomboid family intramembrane serine protease n=1 Tax=Epibacterium ulvae TaxID=1156985 RepID=UPI002492C713|nr:rhomboid family intramembrane serine protease [Epibacterium ulvae]